RRGSEPGRLPLQSCAAVRGARQAAARDPASRSIPSPHPERSRLAPGGHGMAIWVGTSGYNYPEWRGSFYPEKLAAAKMLPYYAERFPTVEINYTFYCAPNEKILDGLNKVTAERCRLTLK